MKNGKCSASTLSSVQQVQVGQLTRTLVEGLGEALCHAFNVGVCCVAVTSCQCPQQETAARAEVHLPRTNGQLVFGIIRVRWNFESFQSIFPDLHPLEG